MTEILVQRDLEILEGQPVVLTHHLSVVLKAVWLAPIRALDAMGPEGTKTWTSSDYFNF